MQPPPKNGIRSRLTTPVLTAAVLLPLAACGSANGHGAERTTVTVLAASSLTDAFKSAEKAYEKEHPDTDLRISFGGSQELAAQVRQGSPADVVVTADTKTMKDLGEDTGKPTVIARNRLTIATAPGNPEHVRGLADLARKDLKVVLAAPEVPVGRYSRKVLAAQHVRAEPVSQEANVRSVLSKVRLGEADAGIVYVSDVRSAGGKVGTVTIPPSRNSVATYPAATLADSAHKDLAGNFTAWLGTVDGQRRLRDAGFEKP